MNSFKVYLRSKLEIGNAVIEIFGPFKKAKKAFKKAYEYVDYIPLYTVVQHYYDGVLQGEYIIHSKNVVSFKDAQGYSYHDSTIVL
jgi:hypothetical protein